MRRRLGERCLEQYGPHAGRLARYLHADYHEAQAIYAASQVEREPDPLAAGPEGSSIVQPRSMKWTSADFPRGRVMAALVGADRLRRELQRVNAARERLSEWQPRGQTLYFLVTFACVLGEVRPTRREVGWEHIGQGYRQALALCGGQKKRYRAMLELAWEIIAVTGAVEPEVLEMAQERDAVRVEALAWARHRGFI